MGLIEHCPACGTPALDSFVTSQDVPTSSCLLLDTAAEARAHATGSLELALCHHCGFITNRAFEAHMTSYSAAYEETQACSPRFRAYAHDIAEEWITRHELSGKHVLEIGCGKGEFLTLLSELGDVHGTGIDPAFVPERSAHDPEKLTFVRELFDENHLGLRAEAVVCRHTLEHISDVRGFLRLVRRMLDGRHDAPVLFEVPDTVRVLREGAFWDTYYEHCSYFTPGSLARLFRSEGFTVTDLSLRFGGQYIVLEALPAAVEPASEPHPVEETPGTTAKLVAEYTRAYQRDLSQRRTRLQEWMDAGERVVIWGAGSKGVAWLTSLGVRDAIRYAVDINTRKHGKFMAGTGQQIVGPDFLREYRPHRVVVMNPLYRDEIAAVLRNLAIDTELVDA